MALTRKQLRRLRDERVRTVRLPGDEVPPRAPQPSRRDWAMAPGAVPPAWRRSLAVSWVVVFGGAVLLEPAPADPSAGDPWWAVALFLGLTGALVATGVALNRGRRAGLLAGVAAAGLALVGAALCPVSAHHASVGAWWYLQMAGFAGLVAAPLVALRRGRSTATT